MASKTSGTFNAAAQTSAVIVGREAEVILTGTFSAAVVPEVQDSSGNWAPYSGASLTGPGASMFELALARPWRLRVDAYTSGTIGYELAGEEFVR